MRGRRNVAANLHPIMKNNSDDSFFTDPIDPGQEARALAQEVLCRVFIWIADAPTLEDRGLRASVLLYCVRPDLLNGATLEEIGEASGRTRQAVHKLAENFRLTTGLAA